MKCVSCRLKFLEGKNNNNLPLCMTVIVTVKWVIKIIERKSFISSVFFV